MLASQLGHRPDVPALRRHRGNLHARPKLVWRRATLAPGRSCCVPRSYYSLSSENISIELCTSGTPAEGGKRIICRRRFPITSRSPCRVCGTGTHAWSVMSARCARFFFFGDVLPGLLGSVMPPFICTFAVLRFHPWLSQEPHWFSRPRRGFARLMSGDRSERGWVHTHFCAPE